MSVERDDPETRVDQGVFNFADARRAAGEIVSRSVGGEAISKAAAPRRRYTGGRSLNEGSDSEHDPYWNVQAGPLSSEQSAMNARNVAAQKQILTDEAEQRIRDRFSDPADAEKEITLQRARLRAKDEKKKRGY